MPVTKQLSVAARVQSAIVIGGGLAGIAAALALTKQGVQVTLLESRQRLGGRAGSFIVRDSQGAEKETVDSVSTWEWAAVGTCSRSSTGWVKTTSGTLIDSFAFWS